MKDEIRLPHSDLLHWLEEHVAAPNNLPSESRLLWLGRNAIPHPDQNPQGIIKFRHCREVVRLNYEMTAIPMPDWFYPALTHKVPGNWFLLRLFKAQQILTEIPIRQCSPVRRPNGHCLTCHLEPEKSENPEAVRECCSSPCIDAATGKVICYRCAGRALIDGTRRILYGKAAPTRKGKQRRGPCLRCGLYPGAPIHDAAKMKGASMWHEYASVERGTL